MESPIATSTFIATRDGDVEKRSMRIGEAARRSGMAAKTIRFYEEAGLIAPASRTGNGYRGFGEDDVRRLQFIHRARDLGSGIEAAGVTRKKSPGLRPGPWTSPTPLKAAPSQRLERGWRYIAMPTSMNLPSLTIISTMTPATSPASSNSWEPAAPS